MQSEALDVKISKRKVLSEASDERKTDEMLTYGIE